MKCSHLGCSGTDVKMHPGRSSTSTNYMVRTCWVELIPPPYPPAPLPKGFGWIETLPMIPGRKIEICSQHSISM